MVGLPARAAFALSVRLSGTLSAIASYENPVFDSLQGRWSAAGFATSMFASSTCLYDVIHLAAAASMAVGGGNTTTAADAAEGNGSFTPMLPPTPRPAFTQAVWAASFRGWGATGAMGLDSSGDLYRTMYDVYALRPTSSGMAAKWAVVDRIDARSLIEGVRGEAMKVW